MKFENKNLRVIGDEYQMSIGIRCNKLSPLILIKANGDTEFAINLTDKDRLVAEFDEKKDLLLWSWAGQWKTDVFSLSKKDITKHYR